MASGNKKATIISLSQRSSDLVEKLKQLSEINWNHILFDKPTHGNIESVFRQSWEGDAIVSVMANAIAIRSIAKLISDKKTDPAVIGVDEEGRFVVSLLGGHRAGANELAKKIAGEIGATAVVSTASDLKGLPAIDLLAYRMGFNIKNESLLANFMTKILNREKVYLYTDTAAHSFKSVFNGSSVEVLPLRNTGSGPVQGHTLHKIIVNEAETGNDDKTLVLVPKRNFIGVGCKRGTVSQQIIQAINESLNECNLDPLSIAGIATIDIKKDELGLIEAAKAMEINLTFYDKDELSTTPVTKKSQFVNEAVGVDGVSESAALLAAGVGSELLLAKKIIGGVTVSIARANWPLSE